MTHGHAKISVISRNFKLGGGEGINKHLGGVTMRKAKIYIKKRKKRKKYTELGGSRLSTGEVSPPPRGSRPPLLSYFYTP